MKEEKQQIFSVSEITQSIKFILESTFEQINIEGEISNFKAHGSGHWYFSLKDENAIINCTMWKGLNSYVFFSPEDGMKVIVSGRITVYPPRGSYQIDIRSMKPAGVGELQAAFERLKKKLSDEGLFDSQFKKPIPAFPKTIGIITALEGAAIRDMISVAKRRYPLVELIIVPTKVQGAGSAENIVQSIRKLNLLKDIDVIILARGGGSIEDLWSFNEEIVAREIFKSKIPIISGVGHEVDFTIADFVADLRAPTPSVAMELATPDSAELKNFVQESLAGIYKFTENNIENLKNRISDSLSAYVFRYPFEKINKYSQSIDILIFKLLRSIETKLTSKKHSLSLLNKTLELQDLNSILKRGFALIKQNSKFVTRKEKFNPTETTSIKFYDGEVKIK